MHNTNCSATHSHCYVIDGCGYDVIHYINNNSSSSKVAELFKVYHKRVLGL